MIESVSGALLFPGACLADSRSEPFFASLAPPLDFSLEFRSHFLTS